MSLRDYIPGSNTNICFDCQNACGGCSWTEWDPAKKKPRFEPVPGWTAKPVLLIAGTSGGKKIIVETYHITACPQFIPDEPRKSSHLELGANEFIRMKGRIFR